MHHNPRSTPARDLKLFNLPGWIPGPGDKLLPQKRFNPTGSELTQEAASKINFQPQLLKFVEADGMVEKVTDKLDKISGKHHKSLNWW